MAEDFPKLAANLTTIAKSFHGRGWLLGTSGNLSAVVQREPLRLAMSPSGVDKGDLYASEGGVTISGYEMLKGLQGVRTHEHSEWLPIIDNSQNMPALADSIAKTLDEHPSTHGFLLRRHGLYSWGETLAQAKRHIEILEFLLETMGRALHIRGI
jgi:ribulose-5-phosphate 4-epimerase/fuculose-1-phosphate aldolase